MQIVFLDKATITLNGDIDFSCLRALGTYKGFDTCTEDEAVAKANTADVIITNKVPITRQVLAALDNLKLIAVIATGYNNIDLEAARRQNIVVCNVRGYAINSVPQHTFALILNLATKVHLYNADVHAGKWQGASGFTLLSYPTFELSGKTIGIIGFGTIGREVAKIAKAFGMKILAHSASGVKDAIYPQTDLDTLQSDIVTIHCPLTPQSSNLIEAAAIAKMKETAFLINTARGGIINEQALADALNSGRIAGAATDVLTVEPPKDGNVLLNARNLIITAHSAWSTLESRQRLVNETANNIKAFIAGCPVNVVI